MKELYLFILASLILLSHSQIKEKHFNLNSIRKLEEIENQAFLLGFDLYNDSDKTNENYKDYNITFNTYILLKNYNRTSFYNLNANNFTIKNVTIIDRDKKKFTTNYNCTISESDKEEYIKEYSCINNYIIKNLSKIEKFIIYEDFQNMQFGKEKKNFTLFSLAHFEKENLINYNNLDFFPDDRDGIYIMENASIIASDSNQFKIKGKYHPSELNLKTKNIQLMIMNNGYTKYVQCQGSKEEDEESEEPFYLIEPINPTFEINTDLSLAVANFTKQNKLLIFDFAPNANSTVQPKRIYKKSSGGLSTGGIVAVVIPCLIILLGIAALVYFLRMRTPGPLTKPIDNKTIGVISSENVIQKN